MQKSGKRTFLLIALTIIVLVAIAIPSSKALQGIFSSSVDAHLIESHFRTFAKSINDLNSSEKDFAKIDFDKAYKEYISQNSAAVFHFAKSHPLCTDCGIEKDSFKIKEIL